MGSPTLALHATHGQPGSIKHRGPGAALAGPRRARVPLQSASVLEDASALARAEGLRTAYFERVALEKQAKESEEDLQLKAQTLREAYFELAAAEKKPKATRMAEKDAAEATQAAAEEAVDAAAAEKAAEEMAVVDKEAADMAVAQKAAVEKEAAEKAVAEKEVSAAEKGRRAMARLKKRAAEAVMLKRFAKAKKVVAGAGLLGVQLTGDTTLTAADNQNQNYQITGKIDEKLKISTAVDRVLASVDDFSATASSKVEDLKSKARSRPPQMAVQEEPEPTPQALAFGAAAGAAVQEEPEPTPQALAIGAAAGAGLLAVQLTGDLDTGAVLAIVCAYGTTLSNAFGSATRSLGSACSKAYDKTLDQLV